MDEGPYRVAGDSASSEPTHCLFCGAERGKDGGCKKCGAWSNAGADQTPDFGFPCPRCKTALEPHAFGRAIIKTCKACHGAFIPALQFSWIVNDYVAGLQLPVGELGAPPPPLAKGETDPRFEKVFCIACEREMDRLTFAARSGATVDVCNMHGIWTDAGELVAMLHFLKTKHDLGEVPVTDAEREDHDRVERERSESFARIAQQQRDEFLAWFAFNPRWRR